MMESSKNYRDPSFAAKQLRPPHVKISNLKIKEANQLS